MTISGIGLNAIIIVIFVGIVCAAVYDYYTRKVLGSFIRRLSDKGADSSENALDRKQLGYSAFCWFFISLSLGENSSLRRYVGTCYSSDELAVLKERGIVQKYYLPKENDIDKTALKRYNGSETSLLKLLLGVVAAAIAAVICMKIFPYAIAMVKGSTNSTENEPVGTRIESTVVSTPESEDGSLN